MKEMKASNEEIMKIESVALKSSNIKEKSREKKNVMK